MVSRGNKVQCVSCTAEMRWKRSCPDGVAVARIACKSSASQKTLDRTQDEWTSLQRGLCCRRHQCCHNRQSQVHILLVPCLTERKNIPLALSYILGVFMLAQTSQRIIADRKTNYCTNTYRHLILGTHATVPVCTVHYTPIT